MQPSLDYRKKNRWGLFLADYQYRFQTEDRQGGSRNFEVIDERRTFQDPEPIVLTNTNVAISSIFVTAEDKTTVYRSGEDYRVRMIGNQIEIERVPTGRILDGQTVLLDYVFLLGGDFTLDTATQNLTLRQNLKFGLSPYYRLRWQDQQISPTGATGVQPENITASIFGAEFQKDSVRLLAEYEDHESNISPFEAIRLSGDYTRKVGRGGTARLRARWVDMDRFEPRDRRTKFLTVEGRHRQRIGDHLTLEGAVLYRNEDDSVSGSNEGVNGNFSLEWIVRETELRVTYEIGRFEDDFARNKTQTLFVQFRRRF